MTAKARSGGELFWLGLDWRLLVSLEGLGGDGRTSPRPQPSPDCSCPERSADGFTSRSPCPKLKPISKSAGGGFLEVGTQPYGGGMWHTWFDRDLGIAGRVIVRRGPARYSHELVRGLMQAVTAAEAA